MSDEYIELNIRSQDITTENKEVYTLFPLIRNHQVSGIVIAVLKNEDTYVEYLKMSPEAENYDTILELFRTQYIKSTLQNKNNISKGSGGPCGFEGAPPCDIDNIIIIVPGGGSGGGACHPVVEVVLLAAVVHMKIVFIILMQGVVAVEVLLPQILVQD